MEDYNTMFPPLSKDSKAIGLKYDVGHGKISKKSSSVSNQINAQQPGKYSSSSASDVSDKKYRSVNDLNEAVKKPAIVNVVG